MAKKTVGYMELEWTCPNCGTRNKGSEEVCSGCGSAQPENVEFHEPVKQELIEDEKKIEQAKAGPDIHCAYCGARNPAGTVVCVNCGSNLAEGKPRVTGRVIGAFNTAAPVEVKCPSCGAANNPSDLTCRQCGSALQPAQPPAPAPAPAAAPATKGFPIWIPLVGILAVIAVILFLLLQQKSAGATVSQRLWERTVVIEQFGPVEHRNWRSKFPAEATILSCDQERRYTSNEPVANSQEVCGTPYTVDKGSGFAEVVTDCQYEVYEDYCKYNVNEWSQFTQVAASGQNDTPRWPALQLAENQRSGDQAEEFQIVFNVDGEQKTFNTRDEQLYNQAEVGSVWNLTLNGLGQIVDLERTE